MYRDRDQRNVARRLRNQLTGAEKRLWQLLRAGQLDGHKFRRQAALGAYVVDFICLAKKLVVELDGPQHAERETAEHDKQRSAWLLARGYRVIRFWNHYVDDDVPRVVEQIRRALYEAAPAAASPSPTLPSKGREPEIFGPTPRRAAGKDGIGPVPAAEGEL